MLCFDLWLCPNNFWFLTITFFYLIVFYSKLFVCLPSFKYRVSFDLEIILLTVCFFPFCLLSMKTYYFGVDLMRKFHRLDCCRYYSCKMRTNWTTFLSGCSITFKLSASIVFSWKYFLFCWHIYFFEAEFHRCRYLSIYFKNKISSKGSFMFLVQLMIYFFHPRLNLRKTCIHLTLNRVISHSFYNVRYLREYLLRYLNRTINFNWVVILAIKWNQSILTYWSLKILLFTN